MSDKKLRREIARDALLALIQKAPFYATGRDDEWYARTARGAFAYADAFLQVEKEPPTIGDDQ